ncbi:8-oxoguanine deaminase [Phycisphaerae bacterium RAS1]|nr:8-oxoguanine deaminase [Phycisphaerae bacterium RAS1]
MQMLLTNALLADIDPPRVEAGALRIDGGLIIERGSALRRAAGDEVVDCGGAVVLPGLVNGHTHLYSALATGMPPPPVAPHDFLEILRFVWWRLDQALDEEAIAASARIGAIDALHCGTTTLIDHHASPNCIGGSLDLIESALAEVGPRGVLCYETTDRHGRAGRDAGLAENRRFAARCRRSGGGRFAALIGAHASFTLDDDALDALAAIASETGVGVHIHVAEDPCDAADAENRRGRGLLDRLSAHGLLGGSSIFAHGTHLSPADAQRVNAAGVTMAHNPRSNMNNAVGYAPVGSFTGPVMLGTDGIGGDMLAEARAAWFISRHQQAGLTPQRMIEMLAAAARRASASLGVTLGKLKPGAAADVVVTDYHPATPLTTENLAGHLLFGLNARHVSDVLIDGRWRLRGRTLVGLDEGSLRASSQRIADHLWAAM